MCNLGFEIAMRERGITVIKTKVGDRYVLEQMQTSGATLGGEQSGHIIFLEHNTTGDGLVTALQLAAVMQETGKPLSELREVMRRYPQVLVNVPVADKARLATSAAIAEAIHDAETELGDIGPRARARRRAPSRSCASWPRPPTRQPRRASSSASSRSSGPSWASVAHGNIPIGHGSLGAAQLVAAFSAIPADITFVDADGIVRYFSEYRIFSRPESCLDADVLECHWPAEPSRASRRCSPSSATGGATRRSSSTHKDERLVHVRYLALRDAEGAYLGCMEIAQWADAVTGSLSAPTVKPRVDRPMNSMLAHSVTASSSPCSAPPDTLAMVLARAERSRLTRQIAPRSAGTGCAAHGSRQLTRRELIERFGGWLSGPNRGRDGVDKARG